MPYLMFYRTVPKKGFTFKLLPRWDGPFTIVARINPVTYRITNGKQTYAAHVQQLRKYTPWKNYSLIQKAAKIK